MFVLDNKTAKNGYITPDFLMKWAPFYNAIKTLSKKELNVRYL
jgi:hypothetical protein